MNQNNFWAVLLCILFWQPLFSQKLVQQNITEQVIYQAIAHNASDQPLNTQNISLKVELLKNGVEGTLVFSESHQLLTDESGALQIIIGSGNNIIGAFDDIPWNSPGLWSKFTLDVQGNNSFGNPSTSQAVLTLVDVDPNRRRNSSGIPFWSLGGNNNTDPVQDFIGTQNDKDVLFKTNNIERIRIDAEGKSIFSDSVIINDRLTVTALTLPNGAADGRVLTTDDQGNARWQQPVDDSPTNELNTALDFNGTIIGVTDAGGTKQADLSSLEETAEVEQAQATADKGVADAAKAQSEIDTHEAADSDLDETNELNTTLNFNGTSIEITDAGGTKQADLSSLEESVEISQAQATADKGVADAAKAQTEIDAHEAADSDLDARNEIQVLSKTGNTVALSRNGGSFVDEVDDADNNPNNEIQQLLKTGNTLSLTNGGGSVTLTDNVNDADSNPTNEIQSLSYNASNQTLSLSSGNSVRITGPNDNDWRITGSNLISAASGNVGIGIPSPGQKLGISGAIQIGNTSTPTAGAIRFNGSDFQGFDGTGWRSFLSAQPPAASGSVWARSGPSIFYAGGSVGIGNPNPNANLDVVGTIKADKLGVGTTPLHPLHINIPGVNTQLVLDQQQLQGTNINSGNQSTTSNLAQSFTAGQTGDLTRFELKAKFNNRALWTSATIYIFEGDRVDFTKKLHEQALNVGALSFGSFRFHTFNFNTPIPVVAGQQYTFRIFIEDRDASCPHCPHGDLNVSRSSTDVYPGGKAFMGGLPLETMDIQFKTWLSVVGTVPGLIATTDGKVGIRTGTPNSELEVIGKTSTRDFQITNGAVAGHILQSDAQGNANWINPNTLPADTDWIKSGSDMHTNISGNIGIGISSPQAGLDLASGRSIKFNVNGNIGGGDGIIFNDDDAHVKFDGTFLNLKNRNTTPGLQLAFDNSVLMNGNAAAKGTFTSGIAPDDVLGGHFRIFSPKSPANDNAFFLSVDSTSNFLMFKNDGQLIFNSDLSGTDDLSTSYPFQLTSKSQGMMVKIDQQRPNGSNNFMTFVNGQNQIMGRVEGFNLDVDWAPPNPITEFANFVCYVNNTLGALPTDPASAAALAASIILTTGCLDGGVVYKSGLGDYAEYLEKEDYEEAMMFGDIVGVKGGKITKDMSKAEQFMVISLAPIVLGKTPPHDSLEYRYEKVAFMGQVPVKVIGKVKSGDYIIPSGNNDGIGIAVAPENISLAQASQIVGRSWMDSDVETLKFINLVIGVKSFELQTILQRQEQKMEALEAKVTALEKLSVENDQIRSELDQIKAFIGMDSPSRKEKNSSLGRE